MMHSTKVQLESISIVIVIGDAGVGKTNFIYTFDKGRKPLSVNPTIGT
jgi:GTPase SAR1 family protein